MKGFTSIVLLLFFMSGNSYATYSLHYCGGELQSISLVSKSKSCGMCGKASQKSCCSEVQKVLKADDFSKTHSGYSIQSVFVSIIPSFNHANFFRKYNSHIVALLLRDNIPDLKIPLFIRFRSLII